MTTIHETIAELRVLMEKATPGPWDICKWHDVAGGVWTEGPAIKESKRNDCHLFAELHVLPYKNTELIVAMRNHLPAILDRLDALEEVAKAARFAQKVGMHTGPFPDDVEPAFSAIDDALARLDGD